MGRWGGRDSPYKQVKDGGPGSGPKSGGGSSGGSGSPTAHKKENP